jgi:hypothetical protein
MADVASSKVAVRKHVGVQVPLPVPHQSSSMVERLIVNELVEGSNPSSGAIIRRTQ